MSTVNERQDLAMIAVQGPNARAKTRHCCSASRNARGTRAETLFRAGAIILWRGTGYTGEDGFEVMMPAAKPRKSGQAARQGVKPAGLGARDTLRLEAGMNLYGNDMDENHHPLESGLAWTVAFDPPERDFLGREALESARREGGRELVGLLLEERGVLRSHQKVLVAGANPAGPGGEVTSGTFSPTLNRSIALARIPKTSNPMVQVEIRGKLHAARIVKPPFVRHGKSLVDI